MANKKLTKQQAISNLLNKITIVNSCWETDGYVNPVTGYVEFSLGRGSRTTAHRAAYTLLIGEIPKGLLVCHKCDNKKCAYPKHLFLGTHKDNSRDMSKKGRSSNQKKTHCPQGHEYNKENTYLLKGKYRYCNICSKINHRKRYWEEKLDVSKNIS